MRLFRRRNDDANEPADAPAPGASGPADDDVDVARPERDPSGDWMTLPPVATTAKPTMPTTFRVQTLPEILTSHHDSRLSGSLGHAVSADAPSGAVHGLTSSVAAVSPTAGHGELTLREPHHEHHDEPAPAPLVVHRLALNEPAPLSNAAVNETHLPPPVVSRTLANPAPASSVPADGSPLPVMRVVDTARPSAAAAPTTSPSTGAPAADRPLVGDGDDRVGGFEVPLDELLAETSEPDTPRSSAPPELAPPIQSSRRVQRRAEPAAPPSPAIRPAEPAATASGADLPIARLADASPSTPAAPLTGDTSIASTSAAEPSTATAPTAGAPASDLTLRAPAAPSDAGDLEAPIQRLASTSPVAPPASSGSGSTADAAPASSGPIEDAHASPAAAADDEARGPEATAPAPLVDAAPLVGAEPLVSTGTSDEAAGTGSSPGPPPPLDLPLAEPPVQRSVDTAASAPAPAPAVTAASSSNEATTDASDPAAPDRDDVPTPAEAPSTTTAPTLGADGPLVPVQTLADTASAGSTTAPGPGPSSSTLPLAPSDASSVLRAPDPRVPPSASIQRTADTHAAPTASVTAPVQRQASTAGPAATRSTATTPTSSAAAASPSAPLTLVRPLTSATGAPTVGVQRAADTGAIAPLGTLGGPPPAAPASAAAADEPVALRRLGAPADHLESGGVATVATLAAPVQRSATTAPSTSASTTAAAAPAAPAATANGSSLPLHTPAASIPSATDIAVKAGLAERGPTGEVFYTSPPQGSDTETSFTVQRAAEPQAESEAPVQRAWQSATPTVARPSGGPQIGSRRSVVTSTPSETAGSGGGENTDPVQDTKALAEEARKLYPFIRSALESDLRRQLEGKSRAGRFRP